MYVDNPCVGPQSIAPSFSGTLKLVFFRMFTLLQLLSSSSLAMPHVARHRQYGLPKHMNFHPTALQSTTCPASVNHPIVPSSIERDITRIFHEKKSIPQRTK